MDEITKYENLIGNNFNNYFANTTKTLKLKKHPILMMSLYVLLLSTSKTISVIKIKEKYNTQENAFLLTLFSKHDLLSRI